MQDNEKKIRETIESVLKDFDEYREAAPEGFIEKIIKSVKANPLDADVMTEWVAVESKLPQTSKQYLVLVRNKNKEHGIFLHDLALFTEDKQWITEIVWENVTHWVELPNNPEA